MAIYSKNAALLPMASFIFSSRAFFCVIFSWHKWVKVKQRNMAKYKYNKLWMAMGPMRMYIHCICTYVGEKKTDEHTHPNPSKVG